MAYCTAKAIETYSHEYAMHFPQSSGLQGGMPQSPLYDRLKAAGANLAAMVAGSVQTGS